VAARGRGPRERPGAFARLAEQCVEVLGVGRTRVRRRGIGPDEQILDAQRRVEHVGVERKPARAHAAEQGLERARLHRGHRPLEAQRAVLEAERDPALAQPGVLGRVGAARGEQKEQRKRAHGEGF